MSSSSPASSFEVEHRRRGHRNRCRIPDHRHGHRPRLLHLGEHPRAVRSRGRSVDRPDVAPSGEVVDRPEGQARQLRRSQGEPSRAGVQQHHFSYIGDAELGERTNVGAGTITCNYDGKRKFKTKVGKHVLLGSSTMLIAPIELGDEARTAAGSVVTKDVPPGMLAVGVPARLRKPRAPDDARHRNRGLIRRLDERPDTPAADRLGPRRDRGGLRRSRNRARHAAPLADRADARRRPAWRRKRPPSTDDPTDSSPSCRSA